MEPQWVYIAFGIASIVGIPAALYAGVRWILAPHLREAITETVDKTVGPKLEEMPRLTGAVTELTGAIREQTRDTARLTEELHEVAGKVDGLAVRFDGLGQRVATLEGANDVKPPRRRRSAA